MLLVLPRQKVDIKTTGSGTTIITTPLSAKAIVKKFAGTLKDTAWQKEGIDASQWIRKVRDRDWD